MELIKARTACFSGHRTYKAQGQDMSARLTDAIITAISNGYTMYLSGACEGFDIMAAETVILLRESHPIKLCCIVPFAGQPVRWSQNTQERYKSVLSASDAVVTLSEHYYSAAYHARNRYMVDNSGLLIGYYNGSVGGTRFTVEYAGKQGLSVLNLCE